MHRYGPNDLFTEEGCSSIKYYAYAAPTSDYDRAHFAQEIEMKYDIHWGIDGSQSNILWIKYQFNEESRESLAAIRQY